MGTPENLPSIEIVVPPEHQTGVYANYAAISSQTPHDITLDFVQMGPGDPVATATVVARLKLATSFLMPLLHALAKHQSEHEDQMKKLQGQADEGQGT